MPTHVVLLFLRTECIGTEEKLAKAKQLPHITTMNVSHLLEVKATDQERACGPDLADYLLRFGQEAFHAQISL